MNGTDSISSIRSQLFANSWSDQVDGDYLLNPELKEAIIANAKKHAAVLIGLVERVEGTNVILTKRTEKLSSHSGQIAFPGGKIDEDDASPEFAALREAWEEIGLDQDEVQVIGRLPDYYTGSGFRVAPIIGEVSSKADYKINKDEVDYKFEVPLEFLMNPSNHITASKMVRGSNRNYYEMPYEGHYIWGVTAGIIRVMHDRLFST